MGVVLAIDQRDGIDEDRMKDIVIGLLHGSDQPGAAPNGSDITDGPSSVS
jgi:hypothetical protein